MREKAEKLLKTFRKAGELLLKTTLKITESLATWKETEEN